LQGRAHGQNNLFFARTNRWEPTRERVRPKLLLYYLGRLGRSRVKPPLLISRSNIVMLGLTCWVQHLRSFGTEVPSLTNGLCVWGLKASDKHSGSYSACHRTRREREREETAKAKTACGNTQHAVTESLLALPSLLKKKEEEKSCHTLLDTLSVTAAEQHPCQ